jgi:hypothetical protein
MEMTNEDISFRRTELVPHWVMNMRTSSFGLLLPKHSACSFHFFIYFLYLVCILTFFLIFLFCFFFFFMYFFTFCFLFLYSERRLLVITENKFHNFLFLDVMWCLFLFLVYKYLFLHPERFIPFTLQN